MIAISLTQSGTQEEFQQATRLGFEQTTLNIYRNLFKGKEGRYELQGIRKSLQQVTLELFDTTELDLPETRVEIGHWSPSFRVLWKLLEGVVDLDSLTWREFEELVAELLGKDGYLVELGKGRNDSGVDIVAIKDLGIHGLFKAVWQTKKLEHGNKVGVSIVRELADTRNQQGASKGIIATTTYLTKGALARVEREKYLLAKVDRDDLMKWIDRVLQGYRS